MVMPKTVSQMRRGIEFWGSFVFRGELLLETLSEQFAEPEGVVGPVALRRGRSRGLLHPLDLLDPTAQAKQDVRPGPLGSCFLPKLLLQA